MFGLRSARGRAILAGTVLVLLLVAVGAVAVWRASQDQQSLETLDRTSSAATALEAGQAKFWWAQGALSALVISGDPKFVDIYDGTFADAELNLAEARADFLALGKTAEVSAVDDLTRRIGEFNQQVRPTFDILLQADPQAVFQLANATLSQMMDDAIAIVRDWEAAVQRAQQDASAERAAAGRAADVTLWLLLGLSGAALATGIGAVVVLVGSVAGPLAALRASASAIASGDFEARARVSGPEEVASLARDFNEMTDALAAKTEAVRESERRYRLLAENASDHVWTVDLGLRYTYVSPSVTRMRGYTVEEVLRGGVAQALTPASLEIAKKILAEELAEERTGPKDPFRSRSLEVEMNRNDGSTIWTEVSVTFLRDPDGQPVGILGVTRDISERKRAEEERERLHAELEVRAISDGLTGLYNHAHFYDRLAEEIERFKRYDGGFAVAMMDVDNFKRYNDSRGHQMGDEMLRLVADSIRAGLRRSDLAFRYGGDEFAAIMLHADAARAQTAIDRINKRLAKSLKQMNDDAAARLSLSAGVACFGDDGRTADELVRVADAALYRAKWAARTRHAAGDEYAIESQAPPRAMTADAMPVEARILAVVNAFDAMTHDLPHRKAMSRQEALAELEQRAGTQFDAAAVKWFLAWASREGERPPHRRQSAKDDREEAALPTT